jgi:hypothetical protein
MPVYEIAYEVNAENRVFPIYDKLLNSVSSLTKLLVVDSIQFPEMRTVPALERYY